MRNTEGDSPSSLLFFPFSAHLGKTVKSGEDRRVYQEEVFLPAAGLISRRACMSEELRRDQKIW